MFADDTDVHYLQPVCFTSKTVTSKNLKVPLGPKDQFLFFFGFQNYVI